MIYADYNATYPLAEKHVRRVSDLLPELDGNPSSAHYVGRRARAYVEECRSRLLNKVGDQGGGVLVFNSGATESNATIIRGCAEPGQVVLVGKSDHSSVTENLRSLEGQLGLDIKSYTLNKDGSVDSRVFTDLLAAKPSLVVLTHVNSELGTINPIAKLAEEVRKASPKAFIHVDAAQSFGKIGIEELGNTAVDSIAISGHKFGAFKGIGCLYFRDEKRLPRPLIYGGGQEFALRAGTQNMPGIISLGERLSDLESDQDWLEEARQTCIRVIGEAAEVPKVKIHGDPALTTGLTLNLHIEGVTRPSALLAFERAGIAVSGGSACSSGVGKASPTLSAMNLDLFACQNSLRLSFGPGSKLADANAITMVLRGF